MSYNELLARKNRALAVTLLICILLRSIANAFFIEWVKVIPMAVGGIVLTAILLLISKWLHPVIQAYLMVALMSGISIMLMIVFPCTTNYLMFFLAIFFVVIYEDIRPIIIQCVISAICMYIFYRKYAEELANTWSADAMAMCIVYIISGMIVYISLCRFTRQQFTELQKTSLEAKEKSDKANHLLGKIGKSVDILGSTSDKFSDSITVTNEIASQLGSASEDVARRTAEEVERTEDIKAQVRSSVDQLQAIADASHEMKQVSLENADRVRQGGERVENLSEQMMELNARMDAVGSSVGSLADKTNQIVQILGTLNEITSQTNLLSLNASIEAARAGEAGRGFAVVADEIRNLSLNSANFTAQIHEIVEGIAEQTRAVQNELEAGQNAVNICTEHANMVQGFFGDIRENTDRMTAQADSIGNSSSEANSLMQQTMENVNNITANIESTSAAMEEISSSIEDLNGSISKVVDGYQDINEITTDLKGSDTD